MLYHIRGRVTENGTFCIWAKTYDRKGGTQYWIVGHRLLLITAFEVSMLAKGKNPYGTKCVVIRGAEASLSWPLTLQFVVINMLFLIIGKWCGAKVFHTCLREWVLSQLARIYCSSETFLLSSEARIKNNRILNPKRNWSESCISKCTWVSGTDCILCSA